MAEDVARWTSASFTREELILAAVAILLVFDLLFLPWFEVTIGLGSLELSASSPGTGAPDGWLGVIGVLASLALLADLALERLTTAELPTVGDGRGTTRFVLAIIAAACLGLKFILNVHSARATVQNAPKPPLVRRPRAYKHPPDVFRAWVGRGYPG